MNSQYELKFSPRLQKYDFNEKRKYNNIHSPVVASMGQWKKYVPNNDMKNN
jgi:hypothetical protein